MTQEQGITKLLQNLMQYDEIPKFFEIFDSMRKTSKKIPVQYTEVVKAYKKVDKKHKALTDYISKHGVTPEVMKARIENRDKVNAAETKGMGMFKKFRHRLSSKRQRSEQYSSASSSSLSSMHDIDYDNALVKANELAGAFLEDIKQLNEKEWPIIQRALNDVDVKQDIASLTKTAEAVVSLSGKESCGEIERRSPYSI